MQKKVHNDVTADAGDLSIDQHDQYVWHLAYFDPVTQLPNRTALTETLTVLQAIMQHQVSELLPPFFRGSTRGQDVRSSVLQLPESLHHLSLLLINIRRFKEVNDNYGLEIGDRLLSAIGQRLQGQLEAGKLVARTANDEFAIVLPETAGIALPLAIEHVKMAFMEPFYIDEHRLTMDAYIGAAQCCELTQKQATEQANLFQHASIALDYARQVETQSRIYDASMGRKIRYRQNLIERLKTAIYQDQLELAYQPQFSLTTGELVGAEALCRWHDETLGYVSPLEFIPLAEERGLIRALGDWVIQAAVAQLQAWQRAGLPPPGLLSINTSAQQFDTPYMVDYFLDRTRAISAEHIGIELTESVMMRHPEKSMKLLQRLREHGFHVAVDDFGTGFSSLAYLSRFPVTSLKIDKSFVEDMETSHDHFTLVQTIIAMAQSLGLKTVAEGVENHAQERFLKQLGCDAMQGFLRGKPVPADEFAQRWLSQ